MCTDLPTSYESLIHPSTHGSVDASISRVRRSALDPLNRLRSIYEDSKFVTHVQTLYNFPLVANERCGSWYIPLENKALGAYFKSTDGHYGQWCFSPRRLNVHLFELIDKHGGCIIVDSTRRGKSMPDALSKTIPIWCTVMNRLLFPDQVQSHSLRTPRKVVSLSEHAQIEARMQSMLDTAIDLQLDISRFRSQLKRPVRVHWITPGDSSLDEHGLDGYNHVICCTASRRLHHDQENEDEYVQGAGDDAENWAKGLTAEGFWKNHGQLIKAVIEDNAPFLESLIEACVNKPSNHETYLGTKPSRVDHTHLYIGNIRTVWDKDVARGFDGIILCDGTKADIDHLRSHESSRVNTGQSQPMDIRQSPQPKLLALNASLRDGGRRYLRDKLPLVGPFVEKLIEESTNVPRIAAVCSNGKDLSVGVAIVIRCMFSETYAHRSPGDSRNEDVFKIVASPQTYDKNDPRSSEVDKSFIRRQLAAITASNPGVSPRRATLQSVNAFLMPREQQRAQFSVQIEH